MEQVRTRRLLTAMAVDAAGSGLFGPFGLLYGHVVVGLSLPVAGAAVSAAGFAALAFGPVAGVLVDRWSAARVAVLANLLAAAGGVLLLVSRELVLFTVASLLTTAAIRMYWSAFAPLVGDAFPPEQQERWFGLLRAARYAGMAAGGLAASAVLLLGRERGLLVMVALDAASYATAAVLVATARVRPRSTAPAGASQAGASPARPSYRLALADRHNSVLAALNVVCTLLITAPVVAMPVYVLEVLDQPAWVPGVLAGLGTTALAVGVATSHRLVRGRGRLAVLAVANLGWAAGVLTFAAASLPTGTTATFGLLVLAALVLALAEAVYGPTGDSLPIVLAPVGLAGRYTAIHQLGWGVSSAVAPGLVGVLLAAGPTLLWWALAGLALAAALAYRAMPVPAHQRAGTVGVRSEAGSVPGPAPVAAPA